MVEGFHLMMIARPAVLTPEELAALLAIALEIDLRENTGDRIGRAGGDALRPNDTGRARSSPATG